MNDIILSISTASNRGLITQKKYSSKELYKCFTTHRLSLFKGADSFVGGIFEGHKRTTSALLQRTAITLDIDTYPGTMDDLAKHLQQVVAHEAYIYSTFTHSPEEPRVRVVYPLSKPIPATEYAAFVKWVVRDWDLALDPCSYIPNQLMHFPECSKLSEPFSMSIDKDRLCPADYINRKDNLRIADGSSVINRDSVLAQFNSNDVAPSLSDSDIHALLAMWPAQELDYDGWLETGMALHYQCSGDTNGFKLWLAWSQRSEKHDDREMRKKWKSFNADSENIVRKSLRSVYSRLYRNGGISDIALSMMCENTRKVSSAYEFCELTEIVQCMPDKLVPSDAREEILSSLCRSNYLTGFPVDVNHVRRQLQWNGASGNAHRPDWLAPYVYIEASNRYYNLDDNYSINKEAFVAKHAAEPEVLAQRGSAATLAAQIWTLPIARDVLYQPGAPDVFDKDNGRYVNRYRNQGALQRPSYEKGMTVIELFKAHIQFLFPDPHEQALVLSYLAFVVQHPGQRINYTLVIQGPQGVGKTFLANVMTAVLGGNCQMLDPEVIRGRFTSFATGAILNVVEEFRLSGKNRFEVLDKLKAYQTNDQIAVESKGQDQITIDNVTNYLMLTNFWDAIPLEENDRRFFVLSTAIQNEMQLHLHFGGRKETAIYFEVLFDALSDNPEALAQYFLDYPIHADFESKGRAPDTPAKSKMRQSSRSQDEHDTVDAIATYGGPAISERLIYVTLLKRQCCNGDFALPSSQSLANVLKMMGYGPRQRVKVGGEEHIVYPRGDMNKETIREMVDTHLKLAPDELEWQF